MLRASFGTGAGRELEELVWVCYVDLGLGFHHWVLRLDVHLRKLVRFCYVELSHFFHHLVLGLEVK